MSSSRLSVDRFAKYYRSVTIELIGFSRWDCRFVLGLITYVFIFTFFSVSVFGVSAKSMQCSYDNRGNSVPTILLRMQKRLYTEGGLKVSLYSLLLIKFWITFGSKEF